MGGRAAGEGNDAAQGGNEERENGESDDVD